MSDVSSPWTSDQESLRSSVRGSPVHVEVGKVASCSATDSQLETAAEQSQTYGNKHVADLSSSSTPRNEDRNLSAASEPENSVAQPPNSKTVLTANSPAHSPSSSHPVDEKQPSSDPNADSEASSDRNDQHGAASPHTTSAATSQTLKTTTKEESAPSHSTDEAEIDAIRTSSTGQYSCTECGARFSLQILLKKHMQAVHGDSRAFACKLCAYRTARHWNLERHMRKHEQPPAPSARENGSEGDSSADPSPKRRARKQLRTKSVHAGLPPAGSSTHLAGNVDASASPYGFLPMPPAPGYPYHANMVYHHPSNMPAAQHPGQAIGNAPPRIIMVRPSAASADEAGRAYPFMPNGAGFYAPYNSAGPWLMPAAANGGAERVVSMSSRDTMVAASQEPGPQGAPRPAANAPSYASGMMPAHHGFTTQHGAMHYEVAMHPPSPYQRLQNEMNAPDTASAVTYGAHGYAEGRPPAMKAQAVVAPTPRPAAYGVMPTQLQPSPQQQLRPMMIQRAPHLPPAPMSREPLPQYESAAGQQHMVTAAQPRAPRPVHPAMHPGWHIARGAPVRPRP